MEDYDSLVTEFSKLIKDFEEVIANKENLAHQLLNLSEENLNLKFQISVLMANESNPHLEDDKKEVESMKIQVSDVENKYNKAQEEIERFKSRVRSVLKKKPDGCNADSLTMLMKSLEDHLQGLEKKVARQFDSEKELKYRVSDLKRRNSEAGEEVVILSAKVRDLEEEKVAAQREMKRMRDDMQKLVATRALGRGRGTDSMFLLFAALIFLGMLMFVKG